MEPKVKLQAPWEAYRKMVYALFAKDPDINVQSDSCTEKDGKVADVKERYCLEWPKSDYDYWDRW